MFGGEGTVCLRKRRLCVEETAVLGRMKCDLREKELFWGEGPVCFRKRRLLGRQESFTEKVM